MVCQLYILVHGAQRSWFRKLRDSPLHYIERFDEKSWFLTVASCYPLNPLIKKATFYFFPPSKLKAIKTKFYFNHFHFLIKPKSNNFPLCEPFQETIKLKFNFKISPLQCGLLIIQFKCSIQIQFQPFPFPVVISTIISITISFACIYYQCVIKTRLKRTVHWGKYIYRSLKTIKSSSIKTTFL